MTQRGAKHRSHPPANRKPGHSAEYFTPDAHNPTLAPLIKPPKPTLTAWFCPDYVSLPFSGRCPETRQKPGPPEKQPVGAQGPSCNGTLSRDAPLTDSGRAGRTHSPA
ncbi:hypothetical protein AOE01nite_24970 [Acetobacter oeni]|uniref:Uncharacterized protein n=1 Tax=Acetobacter oeni TaxID=304077 RepID=A0A511XMV5_9PROT|nr:hypothetical protein AA21952_0481 [Acetobacter oeni LMG 21952]GEN64273.1 hypothetical protein AOE01nite_24970 [Acetobacter oeni]